MGIRQRFEWSAVVSPNAAQRLAVRPSLAALSQHVYDVASCTELQRIASGGASLLLAQIDDPELGSFWQQHLGQAGSAGSILVTLGVPDAARIARLALLGPVLHVPAPVDGDRLEAQLARLGGRQVTLAALAKGIVGQGSITRATTILREGMFFEAMRRTLGNRMAAAELLQIDRRAVQRMAKLLELPARFGSELTDSRPG